jgi:16S rRNA (uracil1498-N3)-methyltransferase
MSERFYLPGDLDRAEVVLDGAESHHLAHVLRGEVGDTVVVFDGHGREVDAEVVAIGRRTVTLRPISAIRKVDATGPTVTLAVAPPKGDRFRWLVEKATELGVARLIPMQSQRTVVDPGVGKLDKLRHTIVAACKQSGRSVLLDLAEPVGYEQLLGQSRNGRLVVLHPEAPPLARIVDHETMEWTLLIGPEGGFTDDEVAAAIAAGATPASLGATILRTETAAIAAASVVMLSG